MGSFSMSCSSFAVILLDSARVPSLLVCGLSVGLAGWWALRIVWLCRGVGSAVDLGEFSMIVLDAHSGQYGWRSNSTLASIEYTVTIKRFVVTIEWSLKSDEKI